jgi:hypothetical protein
MSDRELRRQMTAAFTTALARLPADDGRTPLRPLRDKLVRIHANYLNSLPQVVLVGRSGAGKTMLANALLGTQAQPAGPGAPTQAVTRLRTTVPADLAENSLLSRLDLIDTPDLQKQPTKDFIRAERPEALVPLLIRGNLGVSDEATLRSFRGAGQVGELAVPLNCVGVLPVDSIEADDIATAMSDARTMAEDFRTKDAASRLFYDLKPVAVQVAAAAYALGPDHLADLRALVTAAERPGQCGVEGLVALVQDGSDDFTDPDNASLSDGADAHRRGRLWDILGRYGLQLALPLVADRATEATLRQRLRDDSGLTAFAQLLTSHFAERADLIRAHAVIARVESLTRQLRDDPGAPLTGWEYATLEEVSWLFRGQAAAARDRLTVSSDCRSGRLSLGPDDVNDALRILGEPGQSVRERLGLDPEASVTDAVLAARAVERKTHWTRLDQFPFDGDTRRACRTVLRECEALVSQTSLATSRGGRAQSADAPTESRISSPIGMARTSE